MHAAVSQQFLSKPPLLGRPRLLFFVLHSIVPCVVLEQGYIFGHLSEEKWVVSGQNSVALSNSGVSAGVDSSEAHSRWELLRGRLGRPRPSLRSPTRAFIFQQ